MCALKRKLFCFLSVLFLFSSLALYSENLDSSPLAVSSAQSGQPSSETIFPDLPEAPKPQITPQMTLEQKQAATLQAWIEWYNLVSLSWNKAKSSYEKLDAARVLQLNSRNFEIESLKSELKRARLGEFLYGAGGFAAGWAAASVIQR